MSHMIKCFDAAAHTKKKIFYGIGWLSSSGSLCKNVITEWLVEAPGKQCIVR